MDRTDQMAGALEALAARVDALQAACEELARENAQLRAREQPVADGGQSAGDVSRRRLLRTAAGAAGAVVTLAAGPELLGGPAAALADGTEGATTFSTSAGTGVTVKCTAVNGTGVEILGPGASEASDYWGLYSAVTNGIGVLATSQHSTALQGTTNSTTGSAAAVLGVVSSTSPGGFSSAVRGQNKGTGGLGIGVWGSHAGAGWGVYATSVSGIGLNAVGGTGTGVSASGATGVSASGDDVGVSAFSQGTAVEANGQATGVNASGQSGYGVLGRVGSGPALPSTQAGVAGQAGGGLPGVAAASDTGPAVTAASTTGPGLTASSLGNGNGVTAHSSNGYGLQASGGKSQLYLVPAVNAGAPTTGTHKLGELHLDKNGSLFVCTALGTPGTWKQVQMK